MQFELRYARATVEDPDRFLIAVRAIAGTTGARIVLFDAEKMAGRDHAVSALRHAQRSFERGNSIARSLEMEALLYAAGSRQTRIGRTFGLHAGENACHIAVSGPGEETWARLGELVRFVPEPEGLDPGHCDRLCELFGITPGELAVVGEERLVELVLERVALLDAFR